MEADPPYASTQQFEDFFQQKLNLSNGADGETIHENLRTSETTLPERRNAPIKHSVSQHYTHSAHVVSALQPLQPSSYDMAAQMLIKNGIAPSTLLRSQLALFEQAEFDQRSRLIELWRVVPPNYARNGGQALADKLGEYQTTNMAQEERLAWLKYQKDACEERASDQTPKPQFQSSIQYIDPTRLDDPGEGSGIWTRQMPEYLSNHPRNDLNDVQFQQPDTDEMQDVEML